MPSLFVTTFLLLSLTVASKLGARLADRLGGDDAHRLTDIDRRAACQVAAIAGGADAVARLAGQGRTNAYGFQPRPFDDLGLFLADQFAPLDDQIAGERVEHVLGHAAAQDAVAQGGDDHAAFDHGGGRDTGFGAAIVFGDDAVLGDVDQTARQVARVGGLERRVGQALARAMGRVEVFEDGQPLLEVGDDRRLDDLARGLGHQAAHTGQLLDLGRRTAGARIGHHVYRVDRHALSDRLHLLHHGVGHGVGALRPGIDDLVVLLALGDQAVLVLLLELLDLLLGIGDQLDLRGRDDQVVLAERNAGRAGAPEAQRHQPVGEDYRLLLAAMAVDQIDDLADFLLGHQAVDQREGHLDVQRQDLSQQHPPRRRLDAHDGRLALIVQGVIAGLDLGVQADRLGIERLLDLADIAEGHAFARLAVALHRQIVEAENDILGRHDDRLAVRRRQDVVRAHHQNARLELRLKRERHMNGHLIAVEIGVEGGADQRMQLDRLALDEDRLEGLDAEAMEGRRAVQQHRMLADHLFEDVPDLRPLLLDHALGRLDGRGHAVEFELRIDEGLEQLESHLLGQTALMQL
jgi:hypothetical protein